MDLLKELIALNDSIPVVETKTAKHGSEYEDSGEFTDELYSIHAQVKEMKKVFASPRWNAWMKITDENFSVKCVDKNQKMVAEFKKFEAALDKLELEMDSAA
jgi:hypothetical protein